MFKFYYSKYNPRGLIFGGGLYIGVFHFKSWFPNALGLIHGGAYLNFMVCMDKSILIFLALTGVKGKEETKNNRIIFTIAKKK